MSSKRALVVDDSKSARAFLSRILERHEIAVDAAESAEAALDYLTRNRPDVIFMDHMMPGMDGFQAVQSIKNNPRTSSIPILMYTSQEGDLYAGQARALGAEGVLPKQIKQADVTKLLFQLRLVSDRRNTVEQSTFTRVTSTPELAPANESAIVVPTSPESAPAADAAPASPPIAELLPKLSLEIRAALDQSLQKTLQTEIAALRGLIGTTLDSHAERLQTDLVAALTPQPVAPPLDVPTLIPERRSWSKILGWTFAFLATCGTAAMTWLWWNQGAELAALRTDLADVYAEVETLRARPEVVSAPAAYEEFVATDAGIPADGSIEGSAADPATVGATSGTTAAIPDDTTAATAPATAMPTSANVAPAAASTQTPPPAVATTVAPAVHVAPESAPPQTPQAQ